MKYYQLITIDRYDIANSSIAVVNEDELEEFIGECGLEQEQIKTIRKGVKGADSEEQSWMWIELVG